MMEKQDFMTILKREMSALDHLIKDGWVKVDYPYGYKSRYEAIDIELWVENNCGEFRKTGRTFFFKNPQDASLFLLRFQ